MTGTEEETPGAPGVLVPTVAVVWETSVGAEETGTTGTDEETPGAPGVLETPGAPGVLVPTVAVVGETSVGAEETGTTGELEETPPVTMVVPVTEVIATLGSVTVADGTV